MGGHPVSYTPTLPELTAAIREIWDVATPGKVPGPLQGGASISVSILLLRLTRLTPQDGPEALARAIYGLDRVGVNTGA
jgi:hypothetical protein